MPANLRLKSGAVLSDEDPNGLTVNERDSRGIPVFELKGRIGVHSRSSAVKRARDSEGRLNDPTWNFILKMAGGIRGLRGGGWCWFSLSVVLGIAALVGIGRLADNLQRTVELQTKGLLGSDLTISLEQKIPGRGGEFFATLGGEQARESAHVDGHLPTRANQRDSPGARLEGTSRSTRPGHRAGSAMARVAAGRTALRRKRCCPIWVQVGDEVTIGQSTFTVAAR